MKRSKFSLSNYKLASFNMGELIPIGLTEVLPGDTIQHGTGALIRCSPLLAPVMHPVHARIHHWYVPHRLVWEDWEDFITGGADGEDESDFPFVAAPASTGFALGSLADYLGCPTGVADIEVSALPFRGYALIFNEWYRDQDLQSELAISYEGDLDTITSTALQNIGWEKDYFTSSRPWPQKGPQITLPLGDTAPVTVTPMEGANVRQFQRTSSAGDSNITIQQAGGGDGTNIDFSGTANLAGASAITVTALREAMGLQRFAENRARYGSRYTEYLRYLGIKSSDARLQRPEYLGGGKQTIQFSEVLATAETEVDSEVTSVGTLRGHGIGAMRSNRYRRFFEEHGYVFSFVSVKPRTMYIQGIPRHWNRRVREDFWQQELQHIGQQEVFNRELYLLHSNPGGVFGFQDRYDEYRRMESTVNGEFRTTNLNYWHMARTFSSDPVLNEQFVVSNPTDRIFAVPPSTADTLWCMFHHSIQARRMVAKEGTSYIY